MTNLKFADTLYIMNNNIESAPERLNSEAESNLNEFKKAKEFYRTAKENLARSLANLTETEKKALKLFDEGKDRENGTGESLAHAQRKIQNAIMNNPDLFK